MLRPPKRNPVERQIASFDVQGDGTTGMVVASLVTPDSQTVYTEPEALISDITSRKLRGYYIYSHRLTYDAGVLVPWLPGEADLLFINERLFKGRLSDDGKHRVYLADSSGLWAGLSLSRVAPAIGLYRLPAPAGLVRRGSGDRYHSDDDGAMGTRYEDFTVRESEISYAAMYALQQEIQSLGGELKDTLAATAMNLFRRRYLQTEYYTPYDYRNEFSRKAYYGGRCEPYVLGWQDCVNVYDVHSCYPAMMWNHDYPDPNSLVGPCSPGKGEWILDLEGCSDCLVDVPYMKYPPLPYRVNGQTFFPVGVFRGVWCHNELRYAMSLGVRVREIYYTLYSERSCRPFDGYVFDLWNRRQELIAQGSSKALIYKLLLNSLAGKFGQRPEGGLRELETMESYERGGYQSGTEFVEIRDTVYAKVPVKTKHLPDYIIVPWAAYITAYARIALHQLMLSCTGPVCYVDTDSIHCFEDLPVGNDLGELELQVENCAVDYIAPKMYNLITSDGERKPVAKGVPSEVQGEFCTYKEVAYWKALNWVEAVRLQLNPSEWVKVKRKMQRATPKRRYIRLPGWKGEMWASEPPVVNELPGSR